MNHKRQYHSDSDESESELDSEYSSESDTSAKKAKLSTNEEDVIHDVVGEFTSKVNDILKKIGECGNGAVYAISGQLANAPYMLISLKVFDNQNDLFQIVFIYFLIVYRTVE